MTNTLINIKALSEDDLNNLNSRTVKELKAILTAHKVAGRSKLTKKADIIHAIIKLAHADNSEPVQAQPDAAASKSPYENYKVADLKALLTKYNIKGRSKLTKKADMIDAIIKFEQAQIKQAQVNDVKPTAKAQPEPTKVINDVKPIIIAQPEPTAVINHDKLAYMALKQLREYAGVSIKQIAQELHFSEKVCREAEEEESGRCLISFANRAAIKAYLIGCIVDKAAA